MQKISAALVKAQREFGPALKTSSNPHFKSRYADLAACVEAVIDSLNNNGIALIQQTHECEYGVIVETTFIHESGEQFSAGRLSVPAAKQDPQGYGSALTYARRYSLMAACGIAPEDDDANAATAAVQNKSPAPAPAPKPTNPAKTLGKHEIETITKLAATAGVEVGAIAKAYGVSELGEIPLIKTQEIINRLQEKASTKKEESK